MFDSSIFGSIKTSGVFLLFQNKFAFMVGPNKCGDRLGVVRFGGHIEENESVIECAKREVLEEASAHIRLVSSPITYYKKTWEEEDYENIDASIFDIKPLVVIGDKAGATVLYLAHTEEQLAPAAETHGIILLNKQDIIKLCTEKISLADFVDQGGQLIQSKAMDFMLELSAGPHIRFLFSLIYNNDEMIRMFIERGKVTMQEITMCGYRCDLCKAYAPNIERKDERSTLSKIWSKYYNLDIKPEQIYCDGCRCTREDATRIDNNCPVRKCVMDMDIDHCGNCNNFSCNTFNERKGLTIEEAKSKLGSQFDYDEYQEYLLAYDNFTRLKENLKNK